MDLRETYNLIAEDWHRDHAWDDWQYAGAETFVSRLQPGAVILDIGCGGGRMAQYFSERGLRVTEVDVSEKMIAIAKKEAPSAQFFIGDLREPIMIDHVFDGIFAQAVFLHLTKEESCRALKGLLPILKTAGYFALSVKERGEDAPVEEVVKSENYGYPYERFFRYYSVEEFCAMIQEAGFEVTDKRVFPAGRRARWIEVIAKKP